MSTFYLIEYEEDDISSLLNGKDTYLVTAISELRYRNKNKNILLKLFKVIIEEVPTDAH